MKTILYFVSDDHLLGTLLGNAFKRGYSDVVLYDYHRLYPACLQASLIVDGQSILLAQPAVFVFNTPFLHEADMTIAYGDFICDRLDQLYVMVQFLTQQFIQNGQTARFVFLSVNPSIAQLISFPVMPVYDHAVMAFLKTLSKEMHAMNQLFYGVRFEPIRDLLSPSILRQYPKMMRLFAPRKRPLKIKELAQFLQSFTTKRLDLLSGSVFDIGPGMMVAHS